MPNHRDSTIFSSIPLSDELGWLCAYNDIFESPPSPPATQPITMPTKRSSASLMPANDSLTLLRTKGISRRYHHYQNSTKSSNAKSVSPSSPLHPNLRSVSTSDCSREDDSEGLAQSAPSSSRREWIYRRPRTLSSSSSRRVIRPKSPASSPSPKPKSATRKASNSTSFFPVFGSKSQSKSHNTLPRLVTDSDILHKARSRKRKEASPLSTASSCLLTDSSTSTPLSSRPSTPLSIPSHPSLPPVLSKSPSVPASYRSKPSFTRSSSSVSTTKLPHSPSLSSICKPKSVRKNSTATASTSSNKSVKFVDIPTVHYPPVGWDFQEEEEDGCDAMGIELDAMDLGPGGILDRGANIGSATSLPLPPSFLDLTGSREMLLTPTPEKEKERGLKFRRITLAKEKPAHKRDVPPRSPSKIPRLAISGPFTLGSLATQQVAPVQNPRLPYSKGRGTSLRSVPSVESFRSTKSCASKSGNSIRSFRSLKSLPGSIKSSMSANTRGLRDWFKEKIIGVEFAG